jgi:hypothetical protein
LPIPKRPTYFGQPIANQLLREPKMLGQPLQQQLFPKQTLPRRIFPKPRGTGYDL